MPYSETEELPDRVRNNLPYRAQTIFMGAFNQAWFNYNSDEVCFRKAWYAVKQIYKKSEKTGKWIKKR